MKEIVLKILLIGNSSVGKSCLLSKYVDGFWPMLSISTIGVDFRINTIEIDDQLIQLRIWDTAGQERFRTITKSYYRDIDGVILMYSVDNFDSYIDIDYWMAEINRNCTKDPQIVLAANKTDLSFTRQVTVQQGLDIASKYNIPIMEVSSKKDVNVPEIFELLVKNILANHASNSIASTVNINDAIKERDKCC